jgi:alginate O-acetyltransferase complex protein AlgI
MIFNSFEFLAFFAVVAPLYWLLPLRAQRLLLLAASYVFYMAWRPEYVLLLVVSTLVDYWAGRYLGRPHPPAWRRRAALLASLLTNFGLLFTFKYWRLFGETLEAVAAWLRAPLSWPGLDVLLPVGISFYTFQTVSYTIDVYRGQRSPEPSLLRFALFVSFFPQLVAGPIERAAHLIPQFESRRRFDLDDVVLGLKLMLVGFFKKMVIGDNLAPIVNAAYAGGSVADPIDYLLATYAFAFQIYADFSGYSDIAVGAAKVMGFDLMANFHTPYFAASPVEFWRRWHISLSTWLRDYLYIPLGGNRHGHARTYVNLFVTMLLGGLWHGASWTFVVWGGINGLYLALDKALASTLGGLVRPLRLPAWARRGLGMLVTFHLICFSWIYFRASSMQAANHIVRSITSAIWSGELFGAASRAVLAIRWDEQHVTWMLTAALVAIDVWLGSGKDPARYRALPGPLRALGYATLLIAILAYGAYGANAFIYFQF